MSFIIGINSNECQGIQVIHDSAHNGYISILNDSTKKTDFSIETYHDDTILTTKELTLQVENLIIPSFSHDNEEYRELVVNKDGRIQSVPKSNIKSIQRCNRVLINLWYCIGLIVGVSVSTGVQFYYYKNRFFL
jgi:sensor c-di-GMP phosphodiesterase-like protein